VVGSELIQKYLGDGPKLVRELFRVADELSPSIVFIGEGYISSVLAKSPCSGWQVPVLLCQCSVLATGVACDAVG
jgi:hypothetical protein